MRPLIGISTYREQARWGVWDQVADLLPVGYAQSIERAGGVPVLLPPGDPDGAASVVARLDALVIAGGADVDPSRYGAEAHARTMVWRKDRDVWELALLAAAPVDLPVLGICRGMQVMAVQAGGTLEQHLPDVVGDDSHSPRPGTFGEVEVDVLPRTRLSAAIGDKGEVRCHHHQAVRDHPGFVPAARAADGTLEAMEDPSHRFRVAVQWHPEARDDAGLFAALVAAAGS
jgi:putative glutamine amidotransferase